MASTSSSFPDLLLAQLLDMGFAQNDIAACQLALSSSSTPVTLQAATEWILQSSSNQVPSTTTPPTTTTTSTDTQPTKTPQSTASTDTQPTLVLNTGSPNSDGKTEEATSGNHGNTDPSTVDYSKPMSSGSTMNYAAPLTSRYDLTDEKRKQKEQFISKERDDAVKKARERRLAEMRAKAVVKKQIEEDRQRRAERTAAQKHVIQSPTQPTPPPLSTGQSTSFTGQCRVQIRLPDGNVLRSTFSPDSTLNDVCHFIIERFPQLTNIQLVQPFPRKEFSTEEHSQTLQMLNLCPSASLVVSKAVPVIPPQNEEMDTNVSVPDPVIPEQEPDEEDDDSGQVGIMPHPQPTWPAPPRGVHPRNPLPPPGRYPPPGGLPPGRYPPPGGLPPGRYPPPGGLPPNRFPPPGGFVPPRGALPMPFPAHQGGPAMIFEGEGYRLGGKEAPMKFGDPQSLSKYVTETARNAAVKRAQVITRMTSEQRTSRLTPEVPKLETLCLRALARWSSVDWLPNCSHLPPRVAQNILLALAEAKQLHPKTLNMFMKCPIQSIVLDNYPYATNQLLDMFKYFPSITHLSLVSCTLITDKSMMQLLPYLSQLKFLSLNECHQLSDDIFRNFNGFNNITVLRLASLKLTDDGLMYLTRNSLTSLVELDLSFTTVTAKSLDRLGQRAPNIKTLSIESTQVTDVSSIQSLHQLSVLNVSNCPISNGNICPLAKCLTVSSLNLTGLPVNPEQFHHLVGLSLTSLLLPDKNVFFDDHMPIVAEFPLTCLDLSGYRNVTDFGISCISKMECLTQLFLGRTRLSDEGMMSLKGLINLKQLSLDNTIITDEGIMAVSGLEQLEDLSLSDTKVSSQFICSGALSKLLRLTKLNLVRTFVDDIGLLALCLPALVMLNVDWTCTSTNITIDTLRDKGCRSLETFRNRNIGQPTLVQLLQQQQLQQQQQQQGGIGGVGQPPQPQYYDMSDDDEEEDDYNSD